MLMADDGTHGEARFDGDLDWLESGWKAYGKWLESAHTILTVGQ
jgi:hypothetical protein